MTAAAHRIRTGHPDIRVALLEATVAEVEEVGVDRASLRSIGRRVGVSHQAIAYHFTDRTALFTAVATAGWTEFFDTVSVVLDEVIAHHSGTSPGACVVAVGRCYIRFAREHRGMYSLMFASALLDQDDPELVRAQGRLWALHLNAVEREVPRGWGGTVPRDQLAASTFSMAHGIASLERDLPLAVGNRAEDLLDAVNLAFAD